MPKRFKFTKIVNINRDNFIFIKMKNVRNKGTKAPPNNI